MTELILKQSGTAIHLSRVYETDMAEGLKAMALEGQGVAFLPHSAVKKDLRARRLVSAVPPGLQDLQMVMDVRAYRERPTGRTSPRARRRRSGPICRRRRAAARAPCLHELFA